MAVTDNMLTSGLTGMLYGHVFRFLRGKTIVSRAPKKTTRESSKQRINRSKFKEASAYASQAMRDDGKSAYYKSIARKLKLPNGYTAALKDYLNPVTLAYADSKVIDGKLQVSLMTEKRGFLLDKLTVKASNRDGILIREEILIRDQNKNLSYHAIFDEPYVILSLTVADTAGKEYNFTLTLPEEKCMGDLSSQ